MKDERNGENMQYDVAVIGAGVCGALITRELSKLDLKIVMLEKFSDISMGTSKANSAIVHAGFDAETGSLKAKQTERRENADGKEGAKTQ